VRGGGLRDEGPRHHLCARPGICALTHVKAILAGGMGFDNIIGLPSLDEDMVRWAGGAWYGSLTCTGRKQPADDESRVEVGPGGNTH
jgi:hypothetical protein